MSLDADLVERFTLRLLFREEDIFDFFKRLRLLRVTERHSLQQ